MRFRMDIAYDGTNFHGWAAQPGLRTVQGVLNDAITQLLDDLRLPSTHELTVAGRTDAGVHARGQVAHLDADVSPDWASVLGRRLARQLPDDVLVRQVTPAPPDFDARFGATGRTYCYRLWDTESTPFPVLRQMVTPVQWHLDVHAMAQAGAALVGLRDFAAFCRPRDGATTIRHLRRFDVTRGNDPSGTVECWLEADAFCHSMVRSLVGAVLTVGARRRDLAWLVGVAAGSQRAGDVPVLPPGGLTLEAVTYPFDDQLAARVAQARQARKLDEEQP